MVSNDIASEFIGYRQQTPFIDSCILNMEDPFTRVWIDPEAGFIEGIINACACGKIEIYGTLGSGNAFMRGGYRYLHEFHVETDTGCPQLNDLFC